MKSFVFYLLLLFLFSLFLILCYQLFKKLDIKLWLLIRRKTGKKKGQLLDLKKYDRALDPGELQAVLKKLKNGEKVKIPYAAFDYIYRHIDEVGIINKDGEIVLTKKDTYEKLLKTLQSKRESNVIIKDNDTSRKPGQYYSIFKVDDNTFVKKENIQSTPSTPYVNVTTDNLLLSKKNDTNHENSPKKLSTEKKENKEINKLIKEKIKQEITASLKDSLKDKKCMNSAINHTNKKVKPSKIKTAETDITTAKEEQNIESVNNREIISEKKTVSHEQKTFTEVIKAIDYNKALKIFENLAKTTLSHTNTEHPLIVFKEKDSAVYVELVSLISSILEVYKEERETLEKAFFKVPKSLSMDTFKILEVFKQIQKVIQMKTPLLPFMCLKEDKSEKSCFKMLKFCMNENYYNGVFVPISKEFLLKIHTFNLFQIDLEHNDCKLPKNFQRININRTFLELYFDKV